MNEKAHMMQIEFFHRKGGEPIARFTLHPSDAYDFAHDVLRKYDKLEGIDTHD
jgi:hypothetical protein